MPPVDSHQGQIRFACREFQTRRNRGLLIVVVVAGPVYMRLEQSTNGRSPCYGQRDNFSYEGRGTLLGLSRLPRIYLQESARRYDVLDARTVEKAVQGTHGRLLARAGEEPHRTIPQRNLLIQRAATACRPVPKKERTRESALMWTYSQRPQYYNERSLFSTEFLAGFLGLRWATASSILPLGLQLFEILRTALRDLPPAFPPKSDGRGIFLLCQNAAVKLPCYYARASNAVPMPPLTS